MQHAKWLAAFKRAAESVSQPGSFSLVTFNRNQPWSWDDLDHPRAAKLLSSHTQAFGPVILKEVLHHYAGKDTSEMMFALRKWYLPEAVSWTIQKCAERSSTDVKHGINEIIRELATLADQS